MLWFICFFNYADRMAINAVAKVLQDEYHFTDENLGWIISAFMFVYALSSPFAGQVGDRFRRKSLILGGLAVWSVVTGATGFCRRLIEFVIVRATEGLGETFYFPATMSLISDYHTKTHPIACDGPAPDKRVRGDDRRHDARRISGRVSMAGRRPSSCLGLPASCWQSCSSFSCANRPATKPSGSRPKLSTRRPILPPFP